MKPLVVLTTVGADFDARALAHVLVEARLAACVNIIPAMHSVYRWEGRVTGDDEQLLVVKTTDASGRVAGRVVSTASVRRAGVSGVGGGGDVRGVWGVVDGVGVGVAAGFGTMNMPRVRKRDTPHPPSAPSPLSRGEKATQIPYLARATPVSSLLPVAASSRWGEGGEAG